MLLCRSAVPRANRLLDVVRLVLQSDCAMLHGLRGSRIEVPLVDIFSPAPDARDPNGNLFVSLGVRSDSVQPEPRELDTRGPGYWAGGTNVGFRI